MGHARALVVGAGSIGLRHRRVLEGLGLRTDLVSRRSEAGEEEGARTHTDLLTALRDERPEYVVIATETASHLSVLGLLTQEGFSGTVLVEKPLAASVEESYPGSHPFRNVAVGYQLRFHPAVTASRAALSEARLVTMVASVGQHLAAWRPCRDVGDSASARIEAGGGVLRDLSHELDLVLWLGGDWNRVCALGGRSGALGSTVATDDRWGILLELSSGAVVTVHLDALDRVGRRRLTLVAEDRSVAVDLIEGTVAVASADGRTVDQHGSERDEVLAAMHRALLDGVEDDRLCTVDEGMEVVRLIDAIERSVRTGGWVEREPTR